jgi:hypothetical protein
MPIRLRKSQFLCSAGAGCPVEVPPTTCKCAQRQRRMHFMAILVLLLVMCGAAISAARASMPDAQKRAATGLPPVLSLVVESSGTFDGIYEGTIEQVKQAYVCGPINSWKSAFHVENNKFEAHLGKTLFGGDVQPDGSFETTLPRGGMDRLHLVGKIDGGEVHATITGSVCQWRLNMKKT